MSRFHSVSDHRGPATRLPRVGEIIRHAAPRVIEATVVPTVLFLAAHACFGLAGGLAAALSWSWGRIAWKARTGRAVGGLLTIGALGLSVRTVVAVLSHSTFVYFAAPAVVMTCSGFVILASSVTSRPLVAKVVADVVPLPAVVADHPGTGTLMRRLSALWGIEQMACAGVNLWLLRTMPTARYLMLRAPAGWALAATALALSLAAGRRHLALIDAPRGIVPLELAPAVPVAPVLAVA